MIENYTMGFKRKLQTIRQQGNTLPAVAFNLGPPLPSTGARVMTKVMRNEVCLKIYGRLKAGIFIFFLNWNDCAFINSLQAGASETA